MKLANAIVAKFARRNDDQPDAFEQRLISMGAQKAKKPARARVATPTLFVRHAAHA